MKSDILDQLRAWRGEMPANWYGNPRIDDAVREIERLRGLATPRRKRDGDKILRALDMARDFHQTDSKMYATISEAIEEAQTPAPDEFFDMLWKWFSDESRCGKAEMRSNHEGLSAADFEEMLDEHEAALLGPRPVVSIKPMKLSDGRTDYFVSITVGDREVTPHVFREEYKAAYHVALYDWLLNGKGDEPEAVDFSAEDWPARQMKDVSIPLPMADHDEIGRRVFDQPWGIQKEIVTIAAHCTAIRDQEPIGMVADLAACISTCCLDLAKALEASTSAYEAVKWPNGSNETVPQALRYLADHPRPIGGQDKFNAEHLFQLANEIAKMTAFVLYRKRV